MGAMEDEVRLIRADLDDVEELDGPCELLRGRLDGCLLYTSDAADE